MIQFQRRLLLASTHSSSNPSSSSSSSFLRPDHFMAKLQSRSLHNFPGNFVPRLPFNPACSWNKTSYVSFTKGGVAFVIKKSCPEVGRHYHGLTGLGYGPRPYSVIPSRLKYNFLDSGTSLNITSQGPLNNKIDSSFLNYGFFTKRFLSHDTEVANKLSIQNLNDARSGSSSLPFKGFKKNWKKAKAVTAFSNKSSSSSDAMASSEVDAKMSGKLLGGPVEENSEMVLSSSIKGSKVNKKKKTGTKKIKEEKSSIDVAAENDASKSSKNIEDGSSITRNHVHSKEFTAKKNLVGEVPMEKVIGHASAKPQSNKKRANSGSKGKSVEAVIVTSQKQEQVEKGRSKPQGQKMMMKQLYPPTGKSVVVVESVTKANVIKKYLGDMYEVLPSHGHVRDLAARSGSVRPDDDFSMVWEVPATAWTHLKSIKVSLNGAENLILASDPDREGEAIAWHIIEMLQQQDALHEGVNVSRVVFHEITETSIKSALLSPREIDVNLVHAYLARRALDYLIGFNISPLLWRKLPGCQSAGRVQSAALSLICDRETEIDEFKAQEYWTIMVKLNEITSGSAVHGSSVSAHLTHFDHAKLNQFSISSSEEAKNIEHKIHSENFQVVSSKKSKMRKNPPSPFITSTLQQDAANKLHFSASYTMRLAQKLYEGIQLPDGNAVGLITYTRTDGLHISDEAVKDIRSMVTERYGPNFSVEGPRKYFKKVKNAQEAHEAIRPTDIRRMPSMLVGVLDEDSHKLYSLIWSRTMACQIEPCIIEQIQVDIGSAGGSITFRSASSRVQFIGYQAVFEDSEAKVLGNKENEVNGREEAFEVLRSLKVGDQMNLRELELNQHFSQPPSRYSEGTLVKKLEELGIGRPSTYAITLKVLQDRNYVTVKNRVLYPEFRGRMVSAFLTHLFSEVTDYSFTADMETELDNVSAGLTEWKGLLKDYWTRFSSYCDHASGVHIHQVEKMLEKKFGDFLFSFLSDKSRTCPSCMEGTLIFKVSRFGAGYFIGCDQHPRCKYIAKTLYGDDEEEDTPQANNNVEEPKLLGLHPGSNEKILLKSGPYGSYVQLGEDRKGYLPKRASLSHIKDADSVKLEDAIELLRYPVTLGNHPKDGQPVLVKVAKVGFSIRHRRTIAPVPKNLKPNEISLEKALELLSSKDVKRCGRPKKKRDEQSIEVL